MEPRPSATMNVQAGQLARWEWLFPLRGRWLSIFLGVVWRLALFFYLIAGLAVAEFLPRLASARNVRMTTTTQWALSEEHPAAQKVDFRRGPFPTILRLGPLRFDYAYPARSQPHAPEGRLSFLLQCVVFGLPLLAARTFGPRERFRSFTWKLGVVALVLMFPQAVACGALGCRTMRTWHSVYYSLWSLFSP